MKPSQWRWPDVLTALGVAVALALAVPAGAQAASDDGTLRPQGVTAGGRATQPDNMAAAAADNPGPWITRTEILARAKSWYDAKVPYSQQAYRGGYRTDCSGYVAMAWHTNDNYWWTGDLNTIATQITYNDLRPGDMLLYHNKANPVNGSHVVLFDHWVGAVGGDFVMYEQTKPSTQHRRWSEAGYSRSLYKPFKYNRVL
ncbi:hypothetical protein AB0J74_38860, partial [Asanoa sp. NPDC049573]